MPEIDQRLHRSPIPLHSLLVAPWCLSHPLPSTSPAGFGRWTAVQSVQSTIKENPCERSLRTGTSARVRAMGMHSGFSNRAIRSTSGHPSIVASWCSVKVPQCESAYRGGGLRFRDRPFDEKSSSGHPEDFRIEVFGNPTLRNRPTAIGPGPVPGGCQRQTQTPADASMTTAVTPQHRRATAVAASAASRLSNSGSGPARRSSRKAWRAGGEQSSSGFVTTTAEPGGRSLGRFAVPLSYRPPLLRPRRGHAPTGSNTRATPFGAS